jgi:HEAT repeat protein
MTDASVFGEEERYQALLALDEGSPDALVALTVGLHDESWRVRRAAAEGMKRLPEPARVAEHLVQVLGERGETGARNAAAEALVGLGEVAVEPLVRLLTHPDPDQRKFAADILGQLGLPAAEGALVAALADADLNVSAAAAEALGHIGGEGAVRALERLLKRPETLLRLAALEALAELRRPPPLPVVVPLVEDPRLRRSAYRVLGLIPQVAAAELLCRGLSAEARSIREAALGALGTQARLADAAQGPEMDAAVRSALKRLPGALELVQQAFAAEDVSVRSGALVAVGALRESSLAVLVAEAARDDRLLHEVIRTLSRLGPQGGRELLAHMEELSLPARAAAAQALLELVDASSVPALCSLLEWAEDDLRALAVKALGRTKAPEAVPPLVALLGDGALAGPSVRALGVLSGSCGDTVLQSLEEEVLRQPTPAAVLALARVGGASALPVLRRLARDVDPLLRASAVGATAEVDPVTGLELARMALVDESSAVRVAAARAVGRIGGPAAGTLLKPALHDEDADVRLAAVEAAGECGAVDRVEDLEELVGHPDGAVAGQAMRALGRLGVARVSVLWLAVHHEDPEVVKAALSAGAVLREGAALAVGLLSHARWDVRAAAARVLADSGGRECLESARVALASEQDALARRALMDAVERLARR